MTSASLAKTTAVILAAGQGTRMKSALPKVMHSRVVRQKLSCVPIVCRAGLVCTGEMGDVTEQ